MAENNTNEEIMNINDPLDINELAALNDDISADFIEKLQSQVSQNANILNGNKPKQDLTNLFEEVEADKEGGDKPTRAKFDANIDDNFIKKYKAKLEKQGKSLPNDIVEQLKPKALPTMPASKEAETSLEEPTNVELKETIQEVEIKPEVIKEETTKKKTKKEKETSNENIPAPEVKPSSEMEQIESLTNGNIIEKPLTQQQLDYNESLDYLDENVKYSKYVIYIDPENTEFIESLTVKERKNLINRILKEQDNIVITQKRLSSMQAYIKHAIIAILTIAIATPIIYFTINASLEATINNHRRSQTIFKTLYKEKGKIKNIKNIKY